MDSYLKSIRQYFRQSLIDADLNCPDDKDICSLLKPSSKDSCKKDNANFILIDSSFWKEGTLDEGLTDQFFKKNQEKQRKNALEITEIELIGYACKVVP